MTKYRLSLLVGLGLTVLAVLIGRGGLFHVVGSIYLAGLGIFVGGIVWIVGRVRKRDYRTAASNVAIACVVQLASLPLGMAINEWDVARARAWCEETAPTVAGMSESEVGSWLMENGGGPSLADYQGSTCVQYDRTSLMRWWEYAPASGEWYEVD
jgi:hypothetical protein